MDIQQYFKDNTFDFSHVIAFIYHPEDQGVTFICNYAYNALQEIWQRRKPNLKENGVAYNNDFRLLIFGGVTDYVRDVDSIRKRLQVYKDKYLGKDDTVGFEVDYLDITPINSGDTFNIRWQFIGFGSCSFNFTTLQVDRKLARSTHERDEQGYLIFVDTSTMQPIDYFNPFDIPEHR